MSLLEVDDEDPIEEDLYGQIANDEKLIAKAPVKIDIDKAREEMMRYAEPNDELPPAARTTEGYTAYLRSFLKKE